LKIDAELAGRLVEAQFPHWAQLAIVPVEPAGWDNRTFRLGADMVVRLPSAAAYAPQVLKEHQWLPQLAPKLPLPIPAPLALGSPCQDYPWHWSVYRWIAGEPAGSAQGVDGPRLAAALGYFLAALQGLDPTGGPLPGPENFHRGGPLKTYAPQTERAIALLAGRIDAAAARLVWETALDAVCERPPVWVHGDISLGNLLVDKGELSAVIDFGCSAVGDPACDLAIAWSPWGRDAREALRAALPLDGATWDRGRGWALWKALIILAKLSPAPPAMQEQARGVLDEVLADRPAAGVS
jgi:aminoglycoside phosphotransferase (APT) family kinase protein